MSALADLRDGPAVGQQSWRAVIIMAWSTLGVIYSDIDVMNGIFPASLNEPPSNEDVIGSISAIIWTLTFIPLIKYSFIALRFGTSQGEGGPFALAAALYPGEDEDGDGIAAVTTQDKTRSMSRTTRDRTGSEAEPDRFLHESWLLRLINYHWMHKAIMGIAMFAVALTLSDGALTPAVSVITAVEGLQVASPSLSSGSIIGISIAILVTLYALQVIGTHRISFLFAPIVFMWLMFLAGEGIANITVLAIFYIFRSHASIYVPQHYPGIWRAWDISRLVAWFIRTGDWTLLNGVLLCVTGSEAFFACLGQFSASSITTAFSFVVYPCIILAYLGQGARLISDGADVLPNIFYLTIPGNTGDGLYWVTLVLAILAAIIASQAMITASQSLLQQLMSFNAIPNLRLYHTSDTHSGQVFIPSAVLVLCAASVGLVGGFGTDVGLTNAYGFAVASVFICTTIMITISMPIRRNWPILIALGFFCLYGFIDGLFFAAALYKVPEGAYVPLGAAVILMCFFVFWSWAKGLEHNYAQTHRARLASLLAPYKMPGDNASSFELDDEDEGAPVARSTALEINTFPNKLKKEADTEKGVQRSEGSDKALTDVGAPAYIAENTAHMMLRLTDRAEPLSRIPLVAFFHKRTSGASVPASFESFIRAYPGLPTVVVFLSVKLTAQPRLDASQRWSVRKMRTVPGFYRATARFGYRDPVDLRDLADPLVEIIASIEARDGHEMAPETVAAVRAAAKSAATHILPSFKPIVKPSEVRYVGPAITWVKSFFIESIFGSISLLFPDETGYKVNNPTLRVQVEAELI